MNGLKTAGIALLIGFAVQGIINSINTAKELKEEQKKQAYEAAQGAVEASEQIDELMSKYKELSSEYHETGAMSDEYIDTIYDLIDVFGIQGESIDTLIRKYGSLDEAIRETEISARTENISTILGALDDKTEDAISAAGGQHGKRAWSQEIILKPLQTEDDNNQYLNREYFENQKEELGQSAKWVNDALYQAMIDSINDGDYKGIYSEEDLEYIIQNLAAIKYLRDAKRITEDEFASALDDAWWGSTIRFEDPELESAINEGDIWTILKKREEAKETLSDLMANGHSDSELYNEIYDDWVMLDTAVSELEDDYLTPVTKEYVERAKSIIQPQWEDAPESVEEYNKYIDDIVSSITDSDEDWEQAFDTEENLRLAVENYMAGTELGKQILVANNEDILGRYVAQVESIEDLSKKMEEAQDILTTAQSEMLSGGLSADTVSAISGMLDEGESISDYLTIENGAIELNIQKWRERTQAMSESPSEEFDKEIEGLREEIAANEDDLLFWRKRLLDASRYDQIEDVGVARERIASIEDAIEKEKEHIAQLEQERALYEELFDSSASDYDAMFAGLESVESESSDVVSALESLNEGTAFTQAEMFELARQHPELLSMEGFLEADTVEEQQALLQGLLSAYESTYDGIIEVQIEALQIDMMQALADKNHELAHELQNQIDVLKKIQSADNIPVETEEVDTWDQLTEAVSNTTEAYELLDEVKQQIDDTGSPELETLMSFRDLVGDEAFAGMFKVDENTGEQVFDVGAAEKWLSDSNAVKTRMQELDTEMWTLLADADANSEAIAENRRQWGLLNNELERIESGHISNIFADTLESGIDYADKIADIAEQAQEEFAKFGTVGADTILDLSELTGLDVGGLVDEGYLEQVGDGYKL